MFGTLQPVVEIETLTPDQEKDVQEQFAQNIKKREQAGKQIAINAETLATPVTQADACQCQDSTLTKYSKRAQAWIVKHPLRSVAIGFLVGFAVGNLTAPRKDRTERSNRKESDRNSVNGLSGLPAKKKGKTKKPRAKSRK